VRYHGRLLLVSQSFSWVVGLDGVVGLFCDDDGDSLMFLHVIVL